jgi:hypothetical protein
VGKPEGKRSLGRPRRRWVDNIKMDLKRDKMGCYRLDQSLSGWGPAEGSCEHGDETSGSLKCWEFPEWLDNWQLLRKGSAP